MNVEILKEIFPFRLFFLSFFLTHFELKIIHLVLKFDAELKHRRRSNSMACQRWSRTRSITLNESLFVSWRFDTMERACVWFQL